MLIALCGSGCGEPTRSTREKLNVLLITLDTTRRDHLSAFSRDSPAATPRLDQLAASGTRFDLAISTAAVTPVSHAAILTGLDNHRHGLRVMSAESGYRLDPRIDTLTTLLKGNGYHTAAVHSAFPVSAYFGFDQGFDVFESFETSIESSANDGRSRWDVARFQRRSDETTSLAIHQLQGPNDRPFFLWVHYWDPHDVELIPPTEYLEALDLEPEPLPEDRRLYAAEVSYMDEQVGRLLDELRDRGLENKTLMVVISDHGQGLGDHGQWGHRLLYQEQIHVPLIFYVPDVDHAPVVTDLVRSTDILPTILDYLGLEIPPRLSGKSLRALISGGDEPPRTALADQISLFDLNAGGRKRELSDLLYSVVTKEQKLIYRPTAPELSQFYDLVADPGETTNLLLERSSDAQQLLEVLALEKPWVLEPFRAQQRPEELAEIEQALQALGYASRPSEDTGDTPTWVWYCPGTPDELHETPDDVTCQVPAVPRAIPESRNEE